MQYPEHLTERSAPPYILPELRRHIALVCDRVSLTKLCAVDRLWASEAEPVLYRRVHLFLRRENARAVLGFTAGLARSGARASCVRKLLIEHSGYENNLTPAVLPALGTMLPTLTNLVDLRLRGHNFEFQATMLAAAESPERRFRLHTLYLSQRPIIEMPNSFKDVLRAHASSLRVVGVNAENARYLWSAAMAQGPDPGDNSEGESQSQDLTEPLRADCVRFAFVRRNGNPGRLVLFVHAASGPNIAAVARSLAADPCDQFSGTPVETLQLEWDSGQAPRAELSRAFSLHFPQVKKLELLIRGSMAAIGLDLGALVKTVLPFSLLEALEIMEYYRRRGSSYSHDIPTQRRDFLSKLVDAGCVHLRELIFPDGYLIKMKPYRNL